MKLTKKQKQDFFNCNEGVGTLVMKTNDDNIAIVNFFVSRDDNVRILTDYSPSPIIDLTEFVKKNGI